MMASFFFFPPRRKSCSKKLHRRLFSPKGVGPLFLVPRVERNPTDIFSPFPLLPLWKEELRKEGTPPLGHYFSFQISADFSFSFSGDGTGQNLSLLGNLSPRKRPEELIRDFSSFSPFLSLPSHRERRCEIPLSASSTHRRLLGDGAVSFFFL